jgi:hypothetical protein
MIIAVCLRGFGVNALGCIREKIGPRKALSPTHEPLSHGVFRVRRLVGSSSAGNVVEGVRVGTGAPFLASVESGDRVYVLGAKLEVEDLEVLLYARRRY